SWRAAPDYHVDRRVFGSGFQVLHAFQANISLRPLTVKLRGRPEAPDQASPAHTVFSAGGADTRPVHGPLQRLLELASIAATVRARKRSDAMNGGTGRQVRDARADCPPRTNDAPTRRVFGSSSHSPMTFKLSLGCGL